MSYFAHSAGDSTKPWQTMAEHLNQTSRMAASFASAFNAADFGFICGLLHDIGKYSSEFQHRLRGSKLRVDHSSAGAQLAYAHYPIAGKLLAYCIAGHHGGLQDHGTAATTEGTLISRLNNDVKDYSAYKGDLNLAPFVSRDRLKMPIQPLGGNIGFSISFFVRMLYSCLVDADFLDTERYMSDITRPRGNNTPINELSSAVDSFLKRFDASSPTKINLLRADILHQCQTKATQPTGLYSLTVPTGGGKTYSSLAFALRHAVHNNLNRVIYVIPYTSIIEQNAKVVRDLLGDTSVLEHHSNYQYEDNPTDDFRTVQEKLRLATENWDIPIVLTTNVQFFESLFSNKSSRCRKLHNIAKSVIIFDEAQMLPTNYLVPCLLAVAELTKNYGSTAVLCTATPPSIDELLPEGIKPQEIIDNPRQLYMAFKKVNVVNFGKLDDVTLAAELGKWSQALCIVNTRKHALEIYKLLDDEANSFHLSTMMCPIHRQQTIADIKRRLKNGEPCRVISTQLIEAGVDVDFPVVYRALAGIDSIVQSAGRCNREGKLEAGTVYVFEPSSEHAKIRGYLERTAGIATEVLRHHEDAISLEAIDMYFRHLYSLEGKNLDKKGILGCFEEGYKQLEFDFQEAARKFRLIESATVPIVIPYCSEAEKLIHQARFHPYPLSIARKLQPFTLSVYEHEFLGLLNNAAVETVNDSFIVLTDMERFYDTKTGLVLPVACSGEGIFVG